MDIETLKQEILNKKLTSSFFIFLYSENTFLCNQYVNEISKLLHKEIDFYESEEDVPKSDIFSSGNLSVLNVDELTTCTPIENYIIITRKVSKQVSSQYLSNIVNFPKLEDWQIRDYVYSNLDGISSRNIDNLLSLTNYNIYRLQTEIDKLKCIPKDNRQFIFDRMVEENAFGDLSNNTIFDLTNAIQSKKYTEIIPILQKIDIVGIDVFGLVSILYKMFKKNIMVWFNPNPTPENTGIDNPKQIYAISKSVKAYSKESLINIFEFLTHIEWELKSGYIPINIAIDYIICKILTL